MIHMKHALLLLLLAAPLNSANAQEAAAEQHGDPTTIMLAQRYLQAYSTLDVDALAALYTEDAAFADPTSLEVPGIGGPFMWDGRDEILANIRIWSQSIQSLQYDVSAVYEASGRTVFIGAVNPVSNTPDGPVQYRYPIVTIITVADGHVTEHRDYTNYAGATLVPQN